MPATSADNSILATGRPVRIPTPDDPSGFPNYYRNFRLTTLGLLSASRVPCFGSCGSPEPCPAFARSGPFHRRDGNSPAGLPPLHRGFCDSRPGTGEEPAGAIGVGRLADLRGLQPSCL